MYISPKNIEINGFYSYNENIAVLITCSGHRPEYALYKDMVESIWIVFYYRGCKLSKIRITDTSLRDAHQSLWATRMTTDDMGPVLDKLDNIGYHSLEVWGGATFGACIRYLMEDPWERLRFTRRHIRKTKLQMLLRGQSLVGYAHYPDDVAEK